MVKAVYSDNSNEGLANDLQAMLPGSQKLCLSPNRAAYVIKFGIYPHLKDILNSQLNNSKFVSLSFHPKKLYGKKI